MSCSLAWLLAVRNMLGGGSLWYRTDCGTVQTVLFSAVHYHVLARPAARQSFRYKWGAAGWGEYHMFMFVWSALMTLPEGHPGQLAYAFVIRILSTSRA
jgi:hypothetical protein